MFLVGLVNDMHTGLNRVNSAPKTQEKIPVSPASAAPLSRYFMLRTECSVCL